MNTRSLQGALRILLALVLSLSLAGISAQQAQAATYNVTTLTDSGVGSLRVAIASANANPGADTITFNLSGNIDLTANLPAISEDLTIDALGQNIVINGVSTYRVFYVNVGAVLTVRNLDIYYGYSNSSNGGGIYVAGALVAENITFYGNRAASAGGAIYNHYGTVVVLNCEFFSNSLLNPAGSGGAIYTNQGILTVANSTFVGNSADSGGGITNYDGTTRLTNSTFSENTAATHGGALYSHAGALHLKNTILADSLAPDDCHSDTALASDTRNLIMVNSGCGTPFSSAEPELASLADNGGPTRTLALLPGSPAIDAGSDAVCDAAPVSSLDQRGVSRPHGAHCDIGAYELDKARQIFRSVGTRDGWILESGENTTLGGTLNSDSTVLNLGDGASDKQYRAILSFDTSALPAEAVITRVMLKIRYQGLVGTDPFTILGGLKADIRKPYFGTNIGLVVGDFQAAAGRSNAATFRTAPVNNWYIAVMNSLGYPYINLAGTTQFRLRFLTDDNNDNAADYMKFFTGDHVNNAVHPMLIIDYDIP